MTQTPIAENANAASTIQSDCRDELVVCWAMGMVWSVDMGGAKKKVHAARVHRLHCHSVGTWAPAVPRRTDQ
uniref:Uncharacterized protein n=1 Tax=Ralstonia solanacearum TaxID=305 RepID=A0A0S4UF96_RALSL|nr:protein of unknown function [Ralstonia solanacearum]